LKTLKKFIYYLIEKNNRPYALLRLDITSHKTKTIAGVQIDQYFKKGKPVTNGDISISFQVLGTNPSSPEIGYWIDKLGSQVEQEKTNQKRGKRLPKHHIVSMNQLKENGWKVADLANRFDVSNRTIQRHIRKH
jgi:hypothetical protein